MKRERASGIAPVCSSSVRESSKARPAEISMKTCRPSVPGGPGPELSPRGTFGVLSKRSPHAELCWTRALERSRPGAIPEAPAGTTPVPANTASQPPPLDSDKLRKGFVEKSRADARIRGSTELAEVGVSRSFMNDPG
jgi:hypothetical protein